MQRKKMPIGMQIIDNQYKGTAEIQNLDELKSGLSGNFTGSRNLY